ncbi:MAG: hypothetical protein KTR31_24140 [Myxococcales bacterium]|nr:hypothetical protein [Myxococcales bacterium]
MTSYDEVVGGAVDDVTADVIVSNFALVDEEGTERLVRCLPQLLAAGGRIVIQTVHPLEIARDVPYRSGWRRGSWEGFPVAFVDPAPWYFRTLADWMALFEDAGLYLEQLREPAPPGGGRPLSIVFQLAPRADLFGV